ncbi:uncharacterized protein TNCT_310701 [Trichonephila clavata]|uniref:Uncharacterized protein n=1 Tax=Trichonephila clavata TaxID=2740835 RepID=A0A8X6GHB6_TRICU|nr:uncharacterized protein TNCT_310701 [Trichonephila clavata]
MADWRRFINEIILDHVEESTKAIGGVGKIVEIDKSKFGKREYNRDHRVEGHWILGGVERGPGCDDHPYELNIRPNVADSRHCNWREMSDRQLNPKLRPPGIYNTSSIKCTF